MDSKLALTITSQLLAEEAQKRGYTLSTYKTHPRSRSDSIVVCKKGDKTVYFRNMVTNLTSALGFFIANNKTLTSDILTKNHVSSPDTIVVYGDDTDYQEAKEFLKEKRVVVVKPIDTNEGVGITTNVADEKQLADAITLARKSSLSEKNTIVQEFVEGKEYRFLVIAGKVIAVAHRQPPFVVGDGESTIEQLIAEKNKDPRRGDGHGKPLSYIRLEEVEKYIGKSQMQTIPAVGEKVVLLGTSNLSRGGEATNVTDDASGELKQIAIDAAKACLLNVAGVDIITSDIKSGDSTNSFVIEVNRSPGIRMHQFPSFGEPIDVAKIMFDELEKHSTNTFSVDN